MFFVVQKHNNNKNLSSSKHKHKHAKRFRFVKKICQKKKTTKINRENKIDSKYINDDLER